MKSFYNKFLVLGGMLIAVFFQSQNLPFEAPVPNSQVLSENTSTYQAYIQQMDHYWSITPHNFKGSGIKPYLRWKENSKYLLNPQGELKSRSEIIQSWLHVKNQLAEVEELDDNSQWIPLGPFSHTNSGSWSSGQGRVNVCVVDPSNPNTIYIGSPDGGAWKSTDHGDSWTSITDDLPVWGVSGIAVDYNDSNTLYVSTGDEDGYDSYANGVYKSTDGGQTWTGLGPNSPFIMGEIYAHPTNSNILWVCTVLGLYKTTNAGQSWSNVAPGTTKELRLKPNDPNTLYIVQKNNSDVFIKKSTDGGSTFTTIKTYTQSNRAVIDVTPANPNVLYVLVSDLYQNFKTLDKSTDSGATFTTQNNTTDIFQSYQASYDLAIAVSDTDENKLYTGCLNIWTSSNGGQSFIQYNNWSSPNSPTYSHADIHALHIKNGNLYASTDGGIYISENGGVSMVDKTVNGVNIGQFYRIDVAQTNLSQIVGGLQDNGGFVYHANQWDVYHGADGMDCAIDPTDTQKHYGFIQYGGNLYRYNTAIAGGGQYVASSPNSIAGNWITPLEFGDGGTLYAGYNQLYKLNAGNFVLASQQFFNDNLEIIRVGPDLDTNVMVYDGVTLYKSDGTQAMNFSPMNTWQMGDIHCFDYNRLNENIIYIGAENGIYQSTNAGVTWTNISGSIPTSDYKVGIIHQSSSSNNTIYLATDNAVYYRNDTMSDWQIFSTGLPHSRIRDIEVNNIENHILIATYGRGVWRSPVDSESLEVEEVNHPNSLIYLYPNPAKNEIQINTQIEEKAQLYIYNIEGKEVIHQEFLAISAQTKFNISTLPKGIYLVKITSANHLITKKFIKE